MSKQEKTIYHQHKRNHDEIVKSYNILLTNLLNSIKKANDAEIKIYNRVLILLLGTYAETFLTSFIYETHYKTKEAYFSDEQIKYISTIKTQEDKWKYIIKYAMEKKFAKKYENLNRSEKILFDDLINTFNTHLEPIIRLRNKMAHGYWVYIIGEGEEIKKLQEDLYKENYLSLQKKEKILIQLKNCLIALISSNNSVSYDYDTYYHNIENIAGEISKINFKKWAKEQQEKYERGKKYKFENYQNSKNN